MLSLSDFINKTSNPPRNNMPPNNFTNWPRPHSNYGTPSSRPSSSLSNSTSQDLDTRSPLNNGTPSERF
ncbi:hypothetical protein GEMRC1_000666 [Eukaryota sp. GEM-RC1]